MQFLELMVALVFYHPEIFQPGTPKSSKKKTPVSMFLWILIISCVQKVAGFVSPSFPQPHLSRQVLIREGFQ
jgi:hypothetical protein